MLEYLEAGSGEPPVVLLHAFPFPPEMWRPQLEGLSDRWRIIAPDVAPADHPSMDEMADAVAELIRHLDLPPVVLGGLSMGGYVAFAFLRRHRELVRALILADTRAGADSSEVLERRTKQQETVAREGPQPVLDGFLKGLPGKTTREQRPEVMARVRDLMADSSPDSITSALEAMKQRIDATGDLPGLDLPTLVIVGEEDTVSPPDVAEEMRAGLPNARLARIPAAGHLSNLEDPEAFNAEVRAFLETV